MILVDINKYHFLNNLNITKVIFKNKYRDFDTVEALAKRFNIQLVQFKEETNG